MNKFFSYWIILTFPFSSAYSQFTDVQIGLPGVYGASAEFGDYDGDGDLDILMGGPNRGIYRNDDGVFVHINAGLPDLPYDVAWGDFDNDGDVDALMNGADEIFTRTDYAGI